MIALASSFAVIGSDPLLFVVGLVGLLSLATIPRWGRYWKRRGRLQIHPQCRNWLGKQGFSLPSHFLSLQGMTVSGHPDRNVTRVVIDSDTGPVSCYLKREHRIPFQVKLRHLLSGFGWVSRSLREFQILLSLEQHGFPGPGWIAAGEDGVGRAFLLIRERENTLDLPRLLQKEREPKLRRRVGRLLAGNLARLHHNGFIHSDLYANHILISPKTLEICLIDWQRARCFNRLSVQQRGRDLAALNATLAPTLVTDRDRWYVFHQYLQESYRLEKKTSNNRPSSRLISQPNGKAILAAVIADTTRRLKHRHVLEKRQQGLSRLKQHWHRVQGNALCINSRLKNAMPTSSANWLDLDQQPVVRGKPTTRRWIPLPNNRIALLERSRSGIVQTFFSRLSTPQQKRSVLLLRLERHGLIVPGIMAMGQKKSTAITDSFLLIDHPVKALRIDLWLIRQAKQNQHPIYQGAVVQQRQAVLVQVGKILAQLHHACCYLTPITDAGLFVVLLESASGVEGVNLTVMTTPAVALDDLTGVETSRVVSLYRVRRDLGTLRHILIQAGCTRLDLEAVDQGYRRQGSGAILPDQSGKETLSCQP